jgi:hypothetical protein
MGVKLDPSPKLRVFEHRVLMEIFGAKMEEVTGHWRKFRDDELYDLYMAQNTILVIK